MLSNTEEKKEYFNRYWQTRHLASADARSIQRADLVSALLNPDKGEKILDVGCGRGLLLKRLCRIGFHVSGCDISSETIGILVGEGYNVFLCDLENDPLPRKYDVILCLEVLQQVFDPIRLLEKLKSGLYRGGRLIVSVPNEFHLPSRLKLLGGRSHLGHFDESHLRLFSPVRAIEMFDRAGLTVERMFPVPIIPTGWTGVQTIGRTLARLHPGLFSLSQIYALRIR